MARKRTTTKSAVKAKATVKNKASASNKVSITLTNLSPPKRKRRATATTKPTKGPQGTPQLPVHTNHHTTTIVHPSAQVNNEHATRVMHEQLVSEIRSLKAQAPKELHSRIEEVGTALAKEINSHHKAPSPSIEHAPSPTSTRESPARESPTKHTPSPPMHAAPTEERGQQSMSFSPATKTVLRQRFEQYKSKYALDDAGQKAIARRSLNELKHTIEAMKGSDVFAGTSDARGNTVYTQLIQRLDQVLE